ncbi:MAG: preprotein translocase subunit SecA [Planctomycetota bacterium]
MEFLERIGDFFNWLFASFERFITRRFGAANERVLKKLGYSRDKRTQQATIQPGSTLDRINQFEPEMQKLSDEELQGSAVMFRKRLAAGETLDQILPEAFARVREASRRFLRMRHYDVQLIGGYALHKGMIAEMRTGEGKTLVATLPAYLNALAGKVHLVTVNDYLARRDMEWMAPVYTGLGLTIGAIQSQMRAEDRVKAYQCDITYGTNNEFGFDYLRDNMKPARWDDERYSQSMRQVQGPLDFAIVDEIDNILIDEARTPLIISGSSTDDVTKYAKANQVAMQLKKEVHFEVKEKEHTCHLTDEGVRIAEELAGVESFYTAGNMEWPHLIDNALKAHFLYKRDVNYMVVGEEVVIVDEHTGRAMHGRQWSDGLHQAVEAKERVRIKEETQTLATITLQNFFKLYKKLGGMTGTAMTEATEFLKVYNLDILAIPTNRAMIRKDDSDLIFRTEPEKFDAIVEEVREVHKTGRPILVGTISIEKSELLSFKLTKFGVKHQVLNAKHNEREAEIIAQAGRLGGVTIATNMAGRGTDIILGGNPEPMVWEQLKNTYRTRLDVPKSEWDGLSKQIADQEGMVAQGRQVAELGGLHVIGSERHEARRIDLQLRGRAGRQGDPGSSRFFLSMEDDLLRLFGGDTLKSVLAWVGMKEGEAIEHPMLNSRIEKSQKKVEERHFETRRQLLEYDEVMDQQRKRVYGYRQDILDGADSRGLIMDMFRQRLKQVVPEFLSPKYGRGSAVKWAEVQYGIEVEERDIRDKGAEQMADYMRDQAERKAEEYLRDQIESDLPEDVEDERERNWAAFSKWVNTRYGLNTNERELRKVGVNDIFEEMLPRIHEAIGRYDFSPLQQFSADDYGRSNLSSWLEDQFTLRMQPDEFKDITAEQAEDKILEHLLKMYDAKEIEFPVSVGLTRFMADRSGAPGTERYDREGLAQWAGNRFDAPLQSTTFEGQSRESIRSALLTYSEKYHQNGETISRIDSYLERAYGPARGNDADSDSVRDPKALVELTEWAQSALKSPIQATELETLPRRAARQKILNAAEQRYRPELMQTERSLILDVLDTAWKDHLYYMDHLRQGIGLSGYAGKDPKVEYKREGMRAFEQMWRRISDQVTSIIFRVEESSPDFVGDLWQISAVTHDSAQSAFDAVEEEMMMEGPGESSGPNEPSEKAVEPIRNYGEKVGRNSPCPCGSGKKFKNCHMNKD